MAYLLKYRVAQLSTFFSSGRDAKILASILDSGHFWTCDSYTGISSVLYLRWFLVKQEGG